MRNPFRLLEPCKANRLLSAQHVVYTASPVAGTLHIATKDGEAMFFHDSIDFSAYAGTDAGSTPFRIVFVDSAGKTAWAYGGAVGGGKTLGGELVTDGGFDDPGEWGLSAELDVTGSKLVADGSQSIFVYAGQTTEIALGGLYEVVYTISSITAGYMYARLGGNGNGTSRSTAGTFTQYISEMPSATQPGNTQLVGSPLLVAQIDDFSVKAVTDIPATGLHLMSAKNGTTRNMLRVDSGFNPNTVTAVKVYST